MAFEIVDLACLQLDLCFNNKQVIIFLVKTPQWASVIIVAIIGKMMDLDILFFSFDFLN